MTRPPELELTRERAIQGASALVLAALLAKVANLVSMLVMARLLLRPEIGGFAVALGLVVILAKFSNFAARRDILRDPQLATAKTKAYVLVQGGLSTLIGLAMIFGADLAVRSSAAWIPGTHQDRHMVSILLTSLAGLPLLESITLPAVAWVESRLRFKLTAIAEVLSLFTQAGVAIISAAQGNGPWALVHGIYAGFTVRLLIVWSAALGPVWKAPLDRNALRSVYHFGSTMLATMLVSTAARNLPEVLVGTGAGLAAAGAFKYAYLLPHAAEQIIEQLGRANLAVLGHQDRTQRQGRVFGMTTRFSFLVLMPGIFLGVPHAEFITAAVLGPGWESAAQPLPVLILLVVVRAGFIHWHDVATVHGRADLLLKTSIVSLGALLVFGISLTQSFGALGMAWAALIAWCLPLPFVLRWTVRKTDTRITDLVGPAVLAGALALLLGEFAVASLPKVTVLTRLLVILGQGLTYSIAISRLDRELVALLWGTLRKNKPQVEIGSA
ncbi:MAG: hypothetical protein CSA62_14340 [Planctomycetota bacterium]|nr:MAG: hypothetical protein CSA62_14340 [Planctomycetota bacterium]